MAEPQTVDQELNHSEIDKGDYILVGIWTCNHPDLPGDEEHVMGESEADTFDELADENGAHYHGNCGPCEGYNKFYEGSLDRVEVVDDGTVVQTVEPETLVQEYGMVDDYGDFKA